MQQMRCSPALFLWLKLFTELNGGRACVRARHLENEDFVVERDDVLVLYIKKKLLEGISASVSFISFRHNNRKYRYAILSLFITTVSQRPHTRHSTSPKYKEHKHWENAVTYLQADKTHTASIQDQKQPQRNNIGRRDTSAQNYILT
jgi:hypothetical protein